MILATLLALAAAAQDPEIDCDNAMAQFERKRRWRLRKLWALSRWLGTMIQWENPLLCRARDVQMRLMPDAVATAMMRRLLRHELRFAG